MDDGWLAFKRRTFKSDHERFVTATDLMKQSNLGFITEDEFYEAVAKLANLDVATTRELIRSRQPNEELFSYIEQELKPHYRLGVLSNISGNRLPELLREHHIGLFDEIMLSSETGVTKPDAGAYTIAAERMGVEPEDCLFVDDQESYCTAAREVGMQAVWYQDFEQFKADLKELLAKP